MDINDYSTGGRGKPLRHECKTDDADGPVWRCGCGQLFSFWHDNVGWAGYVQAGMFGRLRAWIGGI